MIANIAMFLRNTVHVVGRLALVLLLFTVVGQFTVGGASLENHYHDFVNSNGFQKGFRVVTFPVTWSAGKISDAVRGSKAWEKGNAWVHDVDQKIDAQVSRQISRASASAESAAAGVSPDDDIIE